MISRGFIVLAVVLLFASGAQARGYNCAVPADRPEGRWDMDQPLTMQVIGDIGAQKFEAPLHFKYRFCGSIENGQQLIMVGMIAIKDSGPVCDAPENFAIFYDPNARTFGKPIPGQTFCFPPPQPPKPAP
jgi:hypothetical protein